jgi:dihydrofolate reductase
MHPIVYDVAVSIDGYIAGPSQDISKFAPDGQVVDDYRERLSAYRVAIMGAATYAFGYRFGLVPGQNPYPHMRTFVFSKSLDLPEDADITRVDGAVDDNLRRIRNDAEGPIYLVGGGRFASALLRLGEIDRLRLKRAPILLGGGTPLFEPGVAPAVLHCCHETHYPDGYLYQEFAVEQAV